MTLDHCTPVRVIRRQDGNLCVITGDDTLLLTIEAEDQLRDQLNEQYRQRAMNTPVKGSTQ